MSQFLSTPWIRIAILTAFAVSVTACGKGQAPAAPEKTAAPAVPPVATIDGTPISRVEYDIYLKSLLRGRPATELTTEQKGQVLDELINMQLLASQGVKDAVDKDPDVAAQLDVVRMRVLADAESAKYLKDKDPTDAEFLRGIRHRAPVLRAFFLRRGTNEPIFEHTVDPHRHPDGLRRECRGLRKRPSARGT